MKTLEELRKLDFKKLLEELKITRKEYFKVNFEIKNGQAKNNHMIRNYRKHIAKIKTLLTAKEEAERENSAELSNPTT